MNPSKYTRSATLGVVFSLFMVGQTVELSAQQGKTNLAHIGIVYPLSTNGTTAALDTNDFSLHAIAGVSQQENRLLIAGVAGVVKGDAHGVMVSGVSNHVGNDATGIQVAGLLNRIGHRADGAQLAGLVNLAGHTRGIQVAGLLNRSGNVTTQVAGLINVAAKVEGIQLAGLINIAEESDYPIGLINIIKQGEMQLGITLDELGTSLVAFRSGGRVLYGILGAGYNFKHEEVRYVVEAGIGAHLVRSRAFGLRAELASAAMTSFEDGVYGKQGFRALAGFRITPKLELFAGPTFNHLISTSGQPEIQGRRYLWQWHGEDTTSGFFVGGLVGLQFSL